MKNIQVALFALAVIGFFVFFANSIPQIESRPPKDVALGADMTPQQLAAAGKQIVETKGACLTCHGIGSPGTRAPDLQGIGARAASRKPATSAEQYLLESLVDPCAYVVEGYQCIMPPMNKPPSSLNDAEIVAVTGYLQSLGGEITVKPVAGTVSSPSSNGAPAVTAASSPQEIMTAMACGACHALEGVAGMAGKVGPDLTHLGTTAAARKPGVSAKDYIHESILDPTAFIAPDCPDGPCRSPSVMPPIFGDRLTAKQLDILVEYLAGLK
ncbi:MAG: c-type cytochrome [Chloroflexi bacterium]|nr:c-type cytochrome [Chloroflexota bacterium]